MNRDQHIIARLPNNETQNMNNYLVKVTLGTITSEFELVKYYYVLNTIITWTLTLAL